jgi:predicted nucleotidyltransferase
MERMRGQIGDFAKARVEIAAAMLFGSAATDTTHPESDIDIAVLVDGLPGEADLMRLATTYTIALEDLLNKPVDIVMLNTASPLLRYQIFKKGKLVFARDPMRVQRFIGDAIVEYLDEIVLIERLQRRSIRRLTGGR